MREWFEKLWCIMRNGKHHKFFNRSKLRLECEYCCWKSKGFDLYETNIGPKR